jgi:ribose transport system permease protein
MTMQSGVKKAGQIIFKEYLILIAIAILCAVTATVNPNFLSCANLTNIMRQFGPLIMVSLGMTFVIIGGFIDLSVAGTLSLVAVVTISLVQPLGQVPALLIGLTIGAFCGYLNSILVLSSGALTQAEALFMTYGMSTVYYAIALLYSGGSTKHMRFITRDVSVIKAIGQGTIGIFSMSFLIFLACLLVLYLFQKKTYMGRTICLTGGNKTAARLCGLPVNDAIKVIFTISGLMTALGAIVLFSRITTASPVIGRGYETNAILAVVVGGTTLKGGNGGVLRTVLGVLLVVLMSNCLNLLGIAPYMQVIMKGAILVVAIWLDNRK